MFAEELIEGLGERIFEGWQALGGKDSAAMRAMADKLEKLSGQKLSPGRLKGLLFGSPQRFLMDLVMMLRQRAAFVDLAAATESSHGVQRALREFVMATQGWQ